MKVARQTFCEKINIGHKLFMSSSDNAYNVVENFYFAFGFHTWLESYDSSLPLKIMNL